MGERERARALGEEKGYGELVKVASPSYSNEVGCISLMGLVCIAAGVTSFFKYSHAWYLDGIEALFVVFGAGILGMLAWPWVQRRPGRSGPRLYCFVDGVVVAVKSQMTAYRWDELRVEVKDWTRGPDYERESGTATTVLDNASGAVVAHFNGVEPGKAGAHRLMLLHKSALKRAAESQES